MRWAEEPCTDKEYQYRLGVTARVYLPFKERTEKIERERKRHESILDDIYRDKKEQAPWLSKARLKGKKPNVKRSGTASQFLGDMYVRPKGKSIPVSGIKRKAASGSKPGVRAS
jgi:hypothetical protein